MNFYDQKRRWYVGKLSSVPVQLAHTIRLHGGYSLLLKQFLLARVLRRWSPLLLARIIVKQIGYKSGSMILYYKSKINFLFISFSFSIFQF